MLLPVHLLAGAALASYIHDPLMLASSAYMLHFPLDSIPHWEYDIASSKKGVIALKAIRDIAIGLVIILLVLSKTSSPEHMLLAVWGGFFGILPDGITFMYMLSDKKLFRLITRFHIFFHTLIVPEHEHPPVWLGVLTQTVVVALSLFALLKF